MTEMENALAAYSDTYKEVHGFRPRGHTFTTLDQVYAAIDRLNEEADADAIRCAERMEKRIAHALELGARDRTTAIRWLIEGDDRHMAIGSGDPITWLWDHGMTVSSHPLYVEVVAAMEDRNS